MRELQRLRCDFAGFFHDARFDSREELPVDFGASSYGVACELDRAVFQGAVVLQGVSCGLFFSANLARFYHPDLTVSFANSKTDYFYARGAMFAGPAEFVGLRCNKDADFSPYVLPFEYPADEPWSEGDIPSRLKRDMEKRFGPLPPSASLVRDDGMWTLRSPETHVRWLLQRDANQVSVSIPSAFVGPSFSIAYAEIGLNLLLRNAVVKAKADFSNIEREHPHQQQEDRDEDIGHRGREIRMLCKGSGFFEGTRFAESVDFSSGQWQGDIRLTAVTFEREVSFESCRLRSLYAYGSTFAANANFTGLACYNARFDPYPIALDDAMFGRLADGEMPDEMKSVLAREGFDIGKSCTLSHRNGRWLVLGENSEQRAYINSSDSQTSLNVVSQFLSEDEALNFDHGQVSWYLNLSDAYVKGAATFNALHCTAGGFFRRTKFDGDVDFRYGEYGINLQMEGVQVRKTAKFEGIAIKSDLVIAGKAVFHEGADFTNAKIGRLTIGYSDPFLKKQTVFNGCTFDFFDGKVTYEKPSDYLGLGGNRPWRRIVDQQDPSHFCLDPYFVLERCERAAGRHAEADDIYHKGRSRETRRALAQLQLLRFFRGMLWYAFVGYGVRRFRTGIWCALVLAPGVVVFWPDDALRPAGKGGDTVPRYTAQLARPPSGSGTYPDEPCTTRLFGGPSAWLTPEQQGRLKQLDIDVSLDGRALDRFVSRVFYSLDEFVPVDLEIAKLCRPAPGWRQFYSAIHIIAGWILIPLLVAAVTGFLGKR